MKLDFPMFTKLTSGMWSLKSLVTLNCESRTSLHAVQYMWQPSSVLMFRPYYYRNGWPK